MPMDPNQIIEKIKQTDFGESVEALENLVVFRFPKVHFRAGQAYGLIQSDGVVLIDTVHKIYKNEVEKLAARHKVKALIITHKDLFESAFGSMEEISEWLGGVPVFAHYDDHQRQKLRDIAESSHRLNMSGILVTHIPGHTKGSVAVYFIREKMLFAGDSAVGAPYESEDSHFTHPVIPMGRWLDFEHGWQNVDGEVLHLLPLHGKPGFYLEDFESIRKGLMKPENLME